MYADWFDRLAAPIRFYYDDRRSDRLAVARRADPHVDFADRTVRMERVRGAAVNQPVRMLALSPMPEEGAGCRFRIAQFMPALERAGFVVTVAPFFDRSSFVSSISHGHYAAKLEAFLRRPSRGIAAVALASRFDLIFIYREAFPIRPAADRALLSLPGRPLVFDFDDAIFLPSVSDANRFVAALKYPQKVASIIRPQRRGDCRQRVPGRLCARRSIPR